jgi:hypothetical protein
MAWWQRKPAAAQAGSVLFRGRWVARPEDFASMERHGVRADAPTRLPDGGWSLPLEHARWGRATLVCLPDAPIPPALLVDMDPRLVEAEKDAARSARTAISVLAEPRTGNVLADRKDLLRFLRAAMGDEGVVAVDHSAQAFWSRAELDEELSHEAELDIDAIYTMHVLQDDAAPASARGFWLHTHGLQEIGFRDFDILDPAEALGGHAHDLLRALAFGTVEGRLEPGAEPFEVVEGQRVRAVPAREFLAGTAPSAHAAYRASADDTHLDGHVVLCDPASRGLLSRLLRGAGPARSRFLAGPFPDEVLIPFSHGATDLLAGRARRTLARFRELVAELAEFEFPAMVKLGYVVDGGADEDREHLWFQVHRFEADAVDATLVNVPFHVARLHEGARGTHSLELLSDWAILTPFGSLTPRHTRTLRQIRDNREKLREVLEASRAEG